MSVEKQNKLKNLLTNWLDKTIATSHWLLTQGVTPQLVKRYIESGWLKSVGHGAFKKLGDEIMWQGALYALQTQLQLPVHVGGLSALSFHGASHYLRLGNESIFLFTQPTVHFPKWFNNWDCGSPIVAVKTIFLPEKLGIKTYQNQNQSIAIKYSTVERAILELLYLAPKQMDVLECYQIIEKLRNLRPDLIQALLEKCTSVKVKRLFLFMADKAQLPVMKYLEIKKIDLGKGDRSIVSQGKFDPKYRLVLPNEFLKNERRI